MQRSKVVLLSALFIPMTAFAGQVYEWKDASGKTHYSDRPPAGVEAKPTRINTGAPRSSATPSDAPPPQTWAEKLKQMNEQQAERQEAEATAKKKTEEEKRRQEACDEAKRQKTLLESGQRVRRVNADGEREVLDDAGRAEEIARIESTITNACGNPE